MTFYFISKKKKKKSCVRLPFFSLDITEGRWDNSDAGAKSPLEGVGGEEENKENKRDRTFGFYWRQFAIINFMEN